MALDIICSQSCPSQPYEASLIPLTAVRSSSAWTAFSQSCWSSLQETLFLFKGPPSRPIPVVLSATENNSSSPVLYLLQIFLFSLSCSYKFNISFSSCLMLLCLASILYILSHVVLSYSATRYEDLLQRWALARPRGKLYLVEDVLDVRIILEDVHELAGHVPVYLR